jgi:UDP-N-acetylmuramyl-tripeptide synthetase
MAARSMPSVEEAVNALFAQGVRSLTTDSRRSCPGTAFLAYPGYVRDGREYVAEALARGASACVVDALGAENFAFDERTIALNDLKQSASALTGQLLERFGAAPSAQLAVTAITGTNGKTSTALWLAQALDALGMPAGVIGTLGVGRPGQLVPTGLTTPDPVVLQNTLVDFVQAGCGYCAMEASSHGIAEGRLNAVRVHTAVFTNLTQDHLDFHGSMQAYGQVKRELFFWPALKAAVVNVESDFGRELAYLCDKRRLNVVRFCVERAGANLLGATQLEVTQTGMRFVISWQGKAVPVEVALVGRYNVENLLAVVGSLLTLGVKFDAACTAISRLSSVPGRMQMIGTVPLGHARPLAVVDYAHTPDALQKALLALRPVANQRGGKLRVVFGCGGDRDASKRPLMGAAAAQFADHVTVTSDNPRTENPEHIIAQINEGIKSLVLSVSITDRAIAIVASIREAKANDVVLIAGKGHEDYQIIGTEKLKFDDVEHARAALAAHWSTA